MALKINTLNLFDKGFFGKSMTEWAEFQKTCKITRPSELKMSSYDDFNKHFNNKINSKIQPSEPKVDMFSKEEPEITETIPGFFI